MKIKLAVRYPSIVYTEETIEIEVPDVWDSTEEWLQGAYASSVLSEHCTDAPEELIEHDIDMGRAYVRPAKEQS